jgi:hypothetical protein
VSMAVLASGHPVLVYRNRLAYRHGREHPVSVVPSRSADIFELAKTLGDTHPDLMLPPQLVGQLLGEDM